MKYSREESLERENSQLHMAVARLQDEVNMKKVELSNIQREFKEIRDENEKLHNENNDLKSNNEALINRIWCLEGQIEAYRYCVDCRR